MGVLVEPHDPAKLAKAAAGLVTLTPSEYRVLKVMLRGGTDAQIAGVLGISVRTVGTIILDLLRKVGCSRSALIAMAQELEAVPTVRAYFLALRPYRKPSSSLVSKMVSRDGTPRG